MKKYIAVKNLRMIITKFKRIKNKVRLIRGQKLVSAYGIRNISLQVKEYKAFSVHASTNVPRVAKAEALSPSTV